MTDRLPMQDASTDACPSPQNLNDWLADRRQLTPTEIQHVNHCRACQRFLETSSDDEALQRFASRTEKRDDLDSFANEPELQALLSTLRPSLVRLDATEMAAASLPGEDTEDGRGAEGTLAEATVVGAAWEGDSKTEPRLADLNWVQSQLPVGRFHLERLLGSGGAGAVFLAYDNLLNRQVAIKLLMRDSQRDRQRLEREAKLLAEIEHPNVVRIFDVGRLDAAESSSNPLAAPELYLVMEYVRGGTAEQLRWLGESADIGKTNTAKATPLQTSTSAVELSRGGVNYYHEVAALFASAADGLTAVHTAGLVHRDVKPSNLLLDAGTRQLKLADFGLARWIDANATMLTRSGDIIGTPAFMSPEQAAGDAHITSASDVYSLGASLYFCLTGSPLFRGQPASVVRQIADVDPVTPRLLNPSIPVDLETVCLKAIEKDVARRYPSTQAFADDLRRFATGGAVHARPPNQFQKLARFLNRNRSLTAALGIALSLLICLLVGAAAAALVFRNQSQRLAIAAENENQAKQAAESALTESIEAADQLLLSVTEDAELLPRTTGTQQISKKLLERARDYYQKILDSGASDGLVVRNAARAHSGLARVALALSDSDAVQREVDAALELIDSIPADQISDLDRVNLAARTLSTLGTNLNYRGDPRGAIEIFGQAERRCRTGLSAATTNGRNSDHESERFALQLLLADVLRGHAIAATTLGNATQAEMLLTEAQQIFEELLQLAPDDETVLLQAAGVASSLGLAVLNRDGYSVAKTHFEASRDLLSQISFDGGVPVRIRAEQAKNVVSLAQIETALGNATESIGLFNEVLVELEQLIALEPSVESHKFDLAVAMLNSCQAEMQLGRIESLRERCGEAAAIMEELVSDSPNVIEYMRTLAKLQANMAIASRMLGDSEAAIAPLRQATELTRQCAQQLGNPPESMYAIALNQYSLSQCYYELDRIKDGMVALNESIATTSELLQHQPEYLPARMHQVDELVAMSDLLLEKEPFAPQEYLANAELAANVSQALLDDFDDLPQYQITHAVVLSVVGEAHLRMGELSKAHMVADAAIEHLQQVTLANEEASEAAKDAYFYNYFLHLEAYAADLRSELENPSAVDEARRSRLLTLVRELLAKCEQFGGTEEELQPFRELVEEVDPTSA